MNNEPKFIKQMSALQVNEDFLNELSVAEHLTNSKISNHEYERLGREYHALLIIGGKFINLAKTLGNICDKERDETSAYCLLRSMADYLSVMLLIFGTRDEDERQFRYLLYMLDGAYGRLNFLKTFPSQTDNSIADADYKQLSECVIQDRKEAEKEIEICIKDLEEHPYKDIINSKVFNELIEKKAWRYKDLNHCKQYSYKELYLLITDYKDVSSWLSSLSDNVHGLSNTMFSNNSQFAFCHIRKYTTLFIQRYIELILSVFYIDKTE